MLPKNLSKNPFDHHVIFGFVVLLFVVFSSAFANAETLTWTKNNGGSGSWHDDTNWNPPQVPTYGDDVSIPVGTDPVLYSTGTTILNSLSCSGSLTISNGILNLSSASSIDTAGTLNLSGGSLGGSGDVTISGDFSWTGGTLTGSGTVTTSGTSTIAGSVISLDGRTLINTGTATWGDVWFYFYNDAQIDNQPSGSITIDSSSYFYLGWSSSGSFTNAGTLTKSGTILAQFYIPFENSGTVQISSGTLRLNTDSTHMGTSSVTVTSGNRLHFAGGVHSFATGAILAGGGELHVFSGTVSFADPVSFAGSVLVSGGATSFNGGADLTAVTLSNGTLGGGGDITISGDFSWTGGTLTGSGTVTTSGTSTIAGSLISLDGRTLINTGTATWGDVWFYFYNDAQIDNQPSGSITIDSSSYFYLGWSSSGSFTNAGTLTKSGTILAQFYIPFENSGTVQISSGTLRLNTDSTHMGTSSVTVTSGNRLHFAGGVHSFATGAILAGGGELHVFSGTVSFADPVSFAGSVLVSGGATSFNGGADLTAVTLSNGTLGGGGDITISGDFSWTGGTLTGSGTVTTSGTSTIAGSLISLDGRTLINTGTATWGDVWFYFYNDAQIDNQPSGSITIDSSSYFYLGSSSATSGSFTNAGTLTKSGTILAQFNIPFENSGTVQISSGTLGLTTNITNNGTIQGSGSLNVSGIEFTNAGNINPGTSAGILTINGNFQQSSIGALNTEIAGTDGSDYDQLNISGNLNLSGILNLSLIEDFLPADSNSFTIVTFSSLNGLFTQINWPALNPGLAWEYRYFATSIELYCGTDTDLDGLPDSLENTTCTLVNDADTDDDDLLDGQEDLNKNGQKEPWETDPCDDDTDKDSMPDGWEAGHGLDPLDPSDCGDDPDEDNLDNCEEYLHDTDPNNADSDADGLPDGWEVVNDLDPLVDDALEDADQDGYSNLREYLSGSDPWDDHDLPPLIADVDTDNDCDGYDLAMFMLEYGRDDCDIIPCDYDWDLDGDVDEIELFLFVEDYGRID